MKMLQRLTNWLESHWVTPAYSGWLLSVLTIFFFIAGTNTLAGWLYVLSGIGAALLAIAALLPRTMLHRIKVRRAPILPVSTGTPLTIELELENPTPQPKSLIQVQDHLPANLAAPVHHAIETLPPRSTYRWLNSIPTERRGVYRWQTVQLRTAAPLGLFWCRRTRTAKAIAVVYPTVLPLKQCPLIDEIGRDASLQFQSDQRSLNATEGVTRSLRPYRWGDPTRLVHWRTSARYGELRVRELETFTGGQELIICLDSAALWPHPADASDASGSAPVTFEEAVIAAASLYFYARHRQMSVRLWTAGTGLIQGSSVVLEALAATQAGEAIQTESLPEGAIVWLTANSASLNTLPDGSRWLLWEARSTDPQAMLTHRFPGIRVNPNQTLEMQLQGQVERQSIA